MASNEDVVRKVKKGLASAQREEVKELRPSQQMGLEGDLAHALRVSEAAEDDAEDAPISLSDFDASLLKAPLPQVGHNKEPQNLSVVLERIKAHREAEPNKVDGTADTLTDDVIVRMRLEGISIRDIARKLQLTEDFVLERFTELMARHAAQTTTSEYRQLQILRLEQLVNLLWQQVQRNDADQTRNMLTVIERLNKMFELENEKSTIEVRIVTDAQARLVIAAVTAVIERILAVPEIAALNLDNRIIDGIAYETLTEAQDLVRESLNNPIVIDKKELTG